MQPQQERRTLRDFGFLDCQHPDGSIAYDRGEPHCGYCGALRVGAEFVGGSIDYRIDLIILKLRVADLARNLQS